MHGVIVVYDITNRNSFDSVRSWMSEIKKYNLLNKSIILVGNKTDMGSKRAVSIREGQSLAEQYGIHFLETSAKENTNIVMVF